MAALDKETIRYFIVYYNDMGDYDYISVLSLDYLKTITSLDLWSGLRPFLIKIRRNSILSSYSLPILVVRSWILDDIRGVINRCGAFGISDISEKRSKDEARDKILELLDSNYQNSKEYRRWIV